MERFCYILLFLALAVTQQNWAQSNKQYKREITLALDGSGDCNSFAQAFEMMRAFMDYKVTLIVKKGEYREKIVVPAWLTNIEIIGEDRDATIICWNDHAKINDMGTFRTYTLRVDGSKITFKNLTIKNNAPPVAQAVALHTEGDAICFINCRFIGNQDTVYTGRAGSRILFENCYIEGTTDFIFGAATAWFENCTIHSKANSYITAASTPQDIEYGYVFNSCKLTAAENVNKVYLGRPWRPYAATIFMNCEMGNHIVAEGWDNWRNAENELTARYAEYNNSGEGAKTKNRVKWIKILTPNDTEKITKENLLNFEK